MNIGADLSLVRALGGAGLALGTALAAWTATGLALLYLYHRVPVRLSNSRRTFAVKKSSKYVLPTFLTAIVASRLKFMGLETPSANNGILIQRVVLASIVIGVVWVGSLAIHAQWSQRWPKR